MFILFVLGQAVIVIIAFRCSVKSHPKLTFKVYVEMVCFPIFAFLIMFGIRMHTNIRAHTQARTLALMPNIQTENTL